MSSASRMTDLIRIGLVLLLLGGCVSERVVLLPSADGGASAVSVRNDADALLLDRPYAVSVQRNGLLAAGQVTSAWVAQRYQAALSSRPPATKVFLLLFESGSDVPTAESPQVLQQVTEEYRQRQSAEIMLIGHTDRVGEPELNEALSQRRVIAVQALLRAAGIADDDMELAYRGEREPLVETPDGVSDARNRRVEISVR
jgi:outer membrane protein OmpA-like peptidoglycan-associated protein